MKCEGIDTELVTISQRRNFLAAAAARHLVAWNYTIMVRTGINTFFVREIYGGAVRPAICCLVAGWEMGEDTQNAKFLCFG